MKRDSSRKTLFVDGSAGAGGDMILGALIDLGAPVSRIRNALRTLPLDGWTLSARRIDSHGIAARKARVRVRSSSGGPPATWGRISRIVRAGELETAVRNGSLEVFRRLFEAEAEVHGTPPDRVHLHEAGGVDAVVDIVGSCLALSMLAPDRIVVSPLTTGFGSVRCRHGLYPVPAPATALLVRGLPVAAGDVEGERLTPTAAALLATVADAWGPMPMMRPTAVGYGAGDRDFGDRPNLLRMILGEAGLGGRADGHGETAVIECTVDDATPQVLAYTASRLFEAGALDVHTTAVLMKKGRPGHLLTALARPEDLHAVAEELLRESTTLGLRYRIEGRIEMDRAVRRVRTRYGTVRVKSGSLGGRELQAWPEYEDCAALARKSGVPLKRIQEAALEAYRTDRRARGRTGGRADQTRSR
jgi:uncharacterized protein (TIGR00299 family) protein